MTIAAADSSRLPRPLVARTATWMTLGILEALAIGWLIETPFWFGEAIGLQYYLQKIAFWTLLGATALAVLAWHRRDELGDLWRQGQTGHAWQPALAIHLALFLTSAAATNALTAFSAGRPEPPWIHLAAYGLLLAVTVATFVRVDVPMSVLLRIAVTFRTELALAFAVGFGVRLLFMLARYGWEPMAAATLTVSKALLELVYNDVAVYPDRLMIRVGDFAVIISRYCSGYEGIALVSGFLTVYLWTFRVNLRFPHAFLLFPIGIVSIWILNCVRIALLVALGAQVSPEMASQGFHSQGGWIAFLAATVGIMAVAQKAFCSAPPCQAAAVAARTDDRTLLAYLAPFMALMAASIVVASAAPHDRPLYALKVLAVGGALWLFRNDYRPWSWRLQPQAVLAGLAVGAAWIATDPDPAGGGELLNWLRSQGTALAAAWIVFRVIGSSITVPIAEELAFRGLLHRWLIARDFNSVPFERFTPIAFCISSVAFGLMHDRWLAGMLAGAAFALVMYRTRSIAGPIAAHMAANALICGWALAFGRWSLF